MIKIDIVLIDIVLFNNLFRFLINLYNIFVFFFFLLLVIVESSSNKLIVLHITEVLKCVLISESLISLKFLKLWIIVVCLLLLIKCTWRNDPVIIVTVKHLRVLSQPFTFVFSPILFVLKVIHSVCFLIKTFFILFDLTLTIIIVGIFIFLIC